MNRLYKDLKNECNLKNFFFIKNGNPPNFNRLQWTSSFIWVLFYRLFTVFYTIAWFIADVSLYQRPHYFGYLTHWGEIAMVFYFFIAFLIVLYEKLWQRPDDNASLRWYHVTAWIIFNIYVTSAITISIAYRIGVNSNFFHRVNKVTAINFHVHVTNAILAVIELLVNNIPVKMLHFYCPLIFGVVYIVFTLIFHWSDLNSSLYVVLDWDNNAQRAVAYMFLGLFIAIVVHVVIVWGLSAVRRWLSSYREP